MGKNGMAEQLHFRAESQQLSCGAIARQDASLLVGGEDGGGTAFGEGSQVFFRLLAQGLLFFHLTIMLAHHEPIPGQFGDKHSRTRVSGNGHEEAHRGLQLRGVFCQDHANDGQEQGADADSPAAQHDREREDGKDIENAQGNVDALDQVSGDNQHQQAE